MTKVAMCPRCKVPLVCTFAFRGAEFYCLDCGGLFGWFGPDAADETPELLAEMEAREQEWIENAAAKLLVAGSYRRDCKQCNEGPHTGHATDEERAADAEARKWIAERVQK